MVLGPAAVLREMTSLPLDLQDCQEMLEELDPDRTKVEDPQLFSDL